MADVWFPRKSSRKVPLFPKPCSRRKTMSITRRDFVKDTTMTAIGTGVALSAGHFASSVLGANERVIVGVIGCGGQGRSNMRDFLRQPEVEIAAVCDVYDTNLNE